MQDYNSLDLVIDLAAKVLRAGRGPSIPYLVDQTILALKIQNKNGAIPVRISASPTSTGHKIAYRLPPGLKPQDLQERLPEIQSQTRASIIDPKINGNIIELEIHLIPLKSSYPFNFSPNDYPSMIGPIPIGIGPRGLIVEDLAKIPHLFIGGTTGGGKSNTTIGIVCSLLLKAPRLQVWVIDRKKTDYNFLGSRIRLACSDQEAEDMLKEVREEMNRRQDLNAAAGVIKYQSYIKRVDPSLPYIVLVIDELAQIRSKKAKEILLELLQLSRSSGFSIVAATQRPSSTMFSDMSFGDFKALFSAVIAMKTKDKTNSRIILDNNLASDLPPIAGRCIWQYASEGDQVQAMFIPVDPEDRPPGYPLAAEIINHVKECVYHANASRDRIPTR